MRITSKGQVTIPAAIRSKAGLLPNTEVDFVLDGAAVRLVKARTAKGKTRGQRAVEALRRAPKPRLTTDQLLALTRGG
jgi:AbrB family looped-hinge helix DNA binding protein